MTGRWGKTDIALERRADDIEWIDGEPHYQGRHIIGRDTDIDGGVYLGGGEREAIVVDSDYGAIPDLYEEAREMASEDGSVNKNYALHSAYETAKSAMEHDKEAVNEIVEKYDVAGDGKIALDVFINNGVGVCRHRALTAGSVIEHFLDDGILTGEVSVDRNQDERGGHAWVRYETSVGDVYVIDPTQDVFAPLEDTGDAFWDYHRPEDNF